MVPVQYGFTAVMGHPDSISTIALSLRSSRTRVVSMVLEILGAVCLMPAGHKRIMDGACAAAAARL